MGAAAMANKAMTVLRGKSDTELQEEILLLRRELFNLRMQKAVGQNQKSSEMRRVRRAIARALTVRAQRGGLLDVETTVTAAGAGVAAAAEGDTVEGAQNLRISEVGGEPVAAPPVAAPIDDPKLNAQMDAAAARGRAKEAKADRAAAGGKKDDKNE